MKNGTYALTSVPFGHGDRIGSPAVVALMRCYIALCSLNTHTEPPCSR